MMAVKYKNIDCFDEFIQNPDVDLNALDRLGQTPAFAATIHFKFEMIRMLGG